MVKNENIVEKSELFDILAWNWFDETKNMWKPSSAVKYRNIINLYLLPEFTGEKISEITRNHVMEYGNKLLSSGGVNGKGLSPKTVSVVIHIFKSIFKYAVRVRNCSLDKEVKNVDEYFDINLRYEKKQMRILSKAEQQRLQKNILTNLSECNLGILLCMYTGLRIGEICALKWRDVITEEQCICIRHTMQRLQTFDNGDRKTQVIVTAPKSECSIRKIPVPDDVFEFLEKYRKTENSYILTGMENKYMEPRTMQNHFKAIIKKCNIENATFHSLRHTFATRCVEIGFDMKSLSEILGHASVNITLNRYVHPSMELKKRNMNMLSEIFNGQ